jgi:hypothetical protein
MDEDGLASAWGGTVSVALTAIPPAPEDLESFPDVVASGAAPNFVKESFDGNLGDLQDDYDVSTVGISKKQWVILVVTHIRSRYCGCTLRSACSSGHP